jgi:hypothetical protein
VASPHFGILQSNMRSSRRNRRKRGETAPHRISQQIEIDIVNYPVTPDSAPIATRSSLWADPAETQLSLDFKWADNVQSPGDVMDLYTSGDTAPEGRFMYRYVGN